MDNEEFYKKVAEISPNLSSVIYDCETWGAVDNILNMERDYSVGSIRYDVMYHHIKENKKLIPLWLIGA